MCVEHDLTCVMVASDTGASEDRGVRYSRGHWGSILGESKGRPLWGTDVVKMKIT
jgi:hypothetical protein